MPSIFLSPSVQEYNLYYDRDGNEEYYMNLIADEMEPYLEANGIAFVRNNPSDSLRQVIRQSNSGDCDLHLALHSNASPERLSGTLTGADFYYYARSTEGRRAATVLADNYMSIYPEPSLVSTMPTVSLAELSRTNAPAVLAELAYHDNESDAEWLKANITAIARNLVQGLTEYFGIPFTDILPADGTNATVITERDRLNIRKAPSLNAEVVAQAPKGSRLTVYGKIGDWYIADYQGTLGFAFGKYVATDKS